MAGKYGVQETVELLGAIEAMAVAVLKEIQKDGFQATDLLAFMQSGAFEASLGGAIDGVQMVPMELTELDWRDGLELGKATYGMSSRLLEALKGAVKSPA